MQIQRITEGVSFNDDDAVAKAMREMRRVPEHELHFYLVQRDTLNSTSHQTRQAIAFAQAEFDRRTTARARKHAYATTVLSSALALAGVVLGAFLAWLFRQPPI